MNAHKHPLTEQRKRDLLPQLERMRAKRRNASLTGALQVVLPMFPDLGVGFYAGPTTRRKPGKAPHIESAVHQFDAADWRGPDWYWLWHVGTYRGRRREILQRVYVEADGEISDYDEIDEVGSYR